MTFFFTVIQVYATSSVVKLYTEYMIGVLCTMNINLMMIDKAVGIPLIFAKLSSVFEVIFYVYAMYVLHLYAYNCLEYSC